MPQTARTYLLDRFRSDALALRTRANALGAAPRTSAPTHGPDATMSRRMAAACDAVVAMIDAVPESADAATALEAIAALIPLLEHRASQEQGAPPVRAVYVGAATRIREVQSAELKAAASGGASDDDDTRDLDDDAFSDAAEDDDDDVDDDDLHPDPPL